MNFNDSEGWKSYKSQGEKKGKGVTRKFGCFIPYFQQTQVDNLRFEEFPFIKKQSK